MFVDHVGPWLTANGLRFSDATLIDDRAGNCAAFASQGGTPVRYKMTANDVTDVVESLNEWFARPP